MKCFYYVFVMSVWVNPLCHLLVLNVEVKMLRICAERLLEVSLLCARRERSLEVSLLRVCTERLKNLCFVFQLDVQAKSPCHLFLAKCLSF